MSVATQTVKKFINDPENVVPEALAGIAAAHSDLVRVDFEHNLVIRADAPVQGKVGLVSGGGSGHEPLHGGFVGAGMLDVACAGAVFTSPVPDQMSAASRAVNGGAGVLHIVKNYTGDVLNFRMAAELVEDDGIQVESVVMNDDVAVAGLVVHRGSPRYRGNRAGREAGGCARRGRRTLAEVADVAKRVNDKARSFGVALTSCATPASGTPIFDLGAEEIEVGVGIHGEPGRRRVKHTTAHEIAEMMIDPILEDLKPASGSSVLAFVNGLGGTPLLELYLLFNEVNQRLSADGLKISRSLVGNHITSLEMAGASITLLVLDDELTGLWDAPVNTAGLRWGV